jgi:hypothetical protein
LGIPCKTAAGHAELASPDCQLSRRHRVLLLLVDGARSLDEVVWLGRQAGVPRSYIDELFALGLIVIGPPACSAISEFAAFDTDARLSRPSPLGGDTIGLGAAMGDTELARLDAQDFSFAQARSGMVTMLRVRRVRSRAELQALLPEVQARLSRSRPPVEAQQLLQRVESLLAAR